ncbi:unnamed protein product [Linum tenue]|uniref:NAC domain-containing protein n=1 Tax=Linum tenue TaxID=586396 RepID=A0AAV0GNJ0_9ROSI|nr:unnamed protein product [Linum tenue]
MTAAAPAPLLPLRATAALLAFNPSEADLIRHLHRKARCGGGGNHLLLPEINVYGDLNPWEMFDKAAVDVWFYAFARLKQRGPSRFHRSVGRGSWTMKSTHTASDGASLKRFFIYEEKDAAKEEGGGDNNGHWTMHEFSLPGAKDNDFVICRVKNRRWKQKRTLPAPGSGNAGGNLIDLSAAEEEDEEEEEEVDWEAIIEEEMEAEAEAEEEESEPVAVELRGEAVKSIGDFDLESKEEVLAMVDNFWAEPPADIGEILCSRLWTATAAVPVADRREFG